MKIKEGVRLQGLQTEMILALMIAETLWAEHYQELVITSVTDGPHSAMSLHYCGRAVDLRTRYFSEEEGNNVFQRLKEELGREFDVVLHSTHIHVEYDPK